MDARLGLSPRPGGRFFGGFGRHFFLRRSLSVPANFFLPALMGDQKQNSRAGDWFIAAHLAAFRPRFPG
jgi:hypothetical protein